MDMMNSLQKAIDYIENNLCDELCTEVIAKQSLMSEFYFRHLFSIVCGVSVGEYIRSRRLTLAGTEITDSDEKSLMSLSGTDMSRRKAFPGHFLVSTEYPL